MPAIRLPIFDQSLFKQPIEAQVKQLGEFIMRYRRELEWLLNGRLDEDNGLSGTVNINTLITNNFLTQTLYADKAVIAELTVDQIDTSDMVKRYLLPSSDPLRLAPVGYWRGYDQYIEFLDAQIPDPDNPETVQVTDRVGRPVYWLDAEHIGTGITFEDTGLPVMRFVYNGPDGDGLVKLAIFHRWDEETSTFNPVIRLGAGNGVGNNGTCEIEKKTDGLYITYIATGAGVVSAGSTVALKVGDDGVLAHSAGAATAIRNIAFCANASEVETALASLDDGDLIVNKDAFQLFTTTGTINRLGPLYVRFTGTAASDLNMPPVPVSGDLFIVKNRGTATVTLKGTFDGATDIAITAGSLSAVQYNGVDWDVM